MKIKITLGLVGSIIVIILAICLGILHLTTFLGFNNISRNPIPGLFMSVISILCGIGYLICSINNDGDSYDYK